MAAVGAGDPLTPALVPGWGVGAVFTLAPSTLQLCPSFSFKSKGQGAGLGDLSIPWRGGEEEKREAQLGGGPGGQKIGETEREDGECLPQPLRNWMEHKHGAPALCQVPN